MKLAAAQSHPDSLRWSIRCDKVSVPIADIGVDVAATSSWIFQIPANCPAQWLELTGRAGDFTQQAEVTIAQFRLRRVRSNG
jgi:hypothetical protein